MHPEIVPTSFSRKADLYDRHAVVQRRYAVRMLAALHEANVPHGGTWCDAGCATGISSIPFCKDFAPDRLVALDLATRSLSILRDRHIDGLIPICCDMMEPPLHLQSCDGVLLASSLHWTRDPVLVIRYLASSLRDNGIFAFSVFSNDNLATLRNLQDKNRIRVPVQYLSHDELVHALTAAGCVVESIKEAVERESFSTAADALRSISDIGAGIVANHLSAGALRRFVDDYGILAKDGGFVVNEYRAFVGIARKIPA